MSGDIIDLGTDYAGATGKSWVSAVRDFGKLDRSMTAQEQRTAIRKSMRDLGILALICAATATYQTYQRTQEPDAMETAAATIQLDRPGP